MIRSGMSLIGPFTPVPWLVRIGFENPIAPMARDLHKLLRWCSEQMDQRIAVRLYPTRKASAQVLTLANQHDVDNLDVRLVLSLTGL